MKRRLLKILSAWVLSAVLTVSGVYAAPSIGAGVTVVESQITEASGVTDAQGNPVSEGWIEVFPVEDEERKVIEITTKVTEEVRTQIEKVNEAIDKAAETGNMNVFKEEIKKMIKEEQIEYADPEDTFDVEACLPLTKIHDVVVKDAAGNIIEGAKNVDVKVEVQNLTEEMRDIRVLHHNIHKEKRWTVIKPEVDYKEKTLFFHLEEVGPLMIVYNPKTGE